MRISPPPDVDPPPGYFWYGQWQHALLLVLLLAGAGALAEPALDGGRFLDVADRSWFWSGVFLAVVHQVLVWLVFRAQLCWGVLTRWFGAADLRVWAVTFLPLLVGRPLLVLAVGLSDAGSLPGPRSLHLFVGLLLFLPAGYAMGSVLRYFGLARALGGDHFREAYRAMPFVRQGAFKYSDNAMYAIVFLALWALALLTGSRAALALAAFQHAYIWVHFYCTEQPDMRLLYSNA